MAIETYTNTKNNITVTCWMISLELWAFRSHRTGGRLHTGIVKAFDRIEAWDKAMEKTEAEEILDREA